MKRAAGAVLLAGCATLTPQQQAGQQSTAILCATQASITVRPDFQAAAAQELARRGVVCTPAMIEAGRIQAAEARARYDAENRALIESGAALMRQGPPPPSPAVICDTRTTPYGQSTTVCR